MELLDEDKLAQFVRSIVISMKPELKSNIDKKDLKLLITPRYFAGSMLVSQQST